jgi:transposase-like protein
MSAKRKNYSIEEKLKIIDKVRSGVSKASINRECGIPEGTIRGWMKEEEKLRAFVNTVETEVGLQRKKTRIGNYSEVDDCRRKSVTFSSKQLHKE